MMRYWLLAVICLMLVVSAATEPVTLDLEPITPDNVVQLEVLRQFGEVSGVFKPAFTPLRLENNQLLFQHSPDQPVQILPTPPENFSKLIANALSPNEQYLVAILADQRAESENHVVMWDMEANSPMLSFTAPVGKTSTIAWHPDSRIVAIGSTIYRAEMGEVMFQHVRRLHNDSDIAWCEGRTETSEGDPALSWSPDGTRYAALASHVCASSFADYGIFDAETGSLLYGLENSTVDLQWQTLLWSPNGTQVTNGFSVWSATTGIYQARLGYEDMYSLDLPSVIWLGNEYLLGSHRSGVMTDAMNLYKWDASSGNTIFQHELAHIKDLRIEEDAITLTSGFAYLSINLETGIIQQTENLSEPLGGPLAWSPDSSRLVVVNSLAPSPLVQVWNAEALLNDPAPLPQWSLNTDWLAYQSQMKTYQPLTSVPIWLSNDEFFTYSTYLWGYGIPQYWARIRRWDQITQQTSDVYWADPAKHTVFPNGDLTRLAELTQDESIIHVLDATTYEEQAQLTGITLPFLSAVRWSPSGHQLAVFDIEGGHDIYLWTIDQANTPRTIPTSSMTHDVVWHPNGRYLALVQMHYTESTRQAKVDIYDIDTGRVINTFTLDVEGSIDETAWSPDGNVLMLATSTSRGLIFLDEFGKHLLAEFPDIQARMETSLQWSPDGRLIAFSANNNHLLLLGVSRD